MPASLLDAAAASETSASCHSPHPVADPLPGCRKFYKFRRLLSSLGCTEYVFLLQVKKNRRNKVRTKELAKESGGFGLFLYRLKKRPQII